MRRDEFLATMQAIVPWAALCAVVMAANAHDKHPLPKLAHGNEQRV